MKKFRKLLGLAVILAVICHSIPASASDSGIVDVEASGAPGVSAECAVLISADDGQVLYEKSAHERRAMASTTKIMTALLTLEEAERSGDPELTVTEEMVRVEGSSMGLQAGNRLTLTNLTAGMLLASGNDAANSAALFLAGSQEEFAEMMNARAEEIGMEDSHFVTPSGLDDEEHYSTAYDMAILAREALENDEFRRIASSASLQVEFTEPAQKITYSNHNKLLRLYEGCIGVKTGFTKKAGRCLVSAASRDGTTLIAVTLNAPDDWNDHMALLDHGFDTVKTVTLGNVKVDDLQAVGGKQNGFTLAADKHTVLTLPIEQAERVSCRVMLPKFLYAPIYKGDKVGEIQYTLDDEPLYTVPIRAAETVEALPPAEKTGWEAIMDKIRGWFGIE